MRKVYESRNYIFILMDIAEGGSLKSFIGARQISRKPITDAQCSAIVRQILSALKSIHKRHIIHRDISPNNILLRSRECIDTGVLVVDFGLGIQVNEYNEEALSKKCGTMLFMAPEQMSGDKCTEVRKKRQVGG